MNLHEPQTQQGVQQGVQPAPFARPNPSCFQCNLYQCFILQNVIQDAYFKDRQREGEYHTQLSRPKRESFMITGREQQGGDGSGSEAVYMVLAFAAAEGGRGQLTVDV